MLNFDEVIAVFFRHCPDSQTSEIKGQKQNRKIMNTTTNIPRYILLNQEFLII